MKNSSSVLFHILDDCFKPYMDFLKGNERNFLFAFFNLFYVEMIEKKLFKWFFFINVDKNESI